MLTGPEFLTTFLYYFVFTTLIVLLVLSQGMGMSLDRSSYVIGMIAGLVAGLVGAYFNRSVTFSTSFKGNANTFERKFQKILSELGFEQNGQMEDFTIYRKSLFTGRVFVKTEKNTVTIISRASIVKRLEDALNLKSNNF